MNLYTYALTRSAYRHSMSRQGPTQHDGQTRYTTYPQQTVHLTTDTAIIVRPHRIFTVRPTPTDIQHYPVPDPLTNRQPPHLRRTKSAGRAAAVA